MERLGAVWPGKAGAVRHGRPGGAGPRRVRRVPARQAWKGWALFVEVRQARSGAARCGLFWRSMAWLGKAGVARFGEARLSADRSGKAGKARRGTVWFGVVRRGMAGVACYVQAWPGQAG